MVNRLYIAELEETERNTEKEDELWTKYSTMYRAYLDSQKAENEDLNFYEII